MIGNLLTCTVPLAGGSQVGLGNSWMATGLPGTGIGGGGWGTCGALIVWLTEHTQPKALDTLFCFWCHSCHLFLALSTYLASYLYLWAYILCLSILLIIGCVPVTGCCCPSVCFLLCALCLMVSLCLSVLCSWTLLRKERYGFFVSSAHSGPAPPRSEASPYLEFSLQRCSDNRGRL